MSDTQAPAPGGALRQRLVTALILGPLVIGGVLWLPGPGFAALIALLVVLGAWEWAGLVGLGGRIGRSVYTGTVALGIWALWDLPHWRDWVIACGAVWWAVQVVRLARVRRVDPGEGVDGTGALAGLVVLITPWAALVELRGLGPDGPGLVLFLLLLIWSADGAAYFAGRRWGREKLAPALSPGKTWAGVYGALALAVPGGIGLAFALGLGFGGAILACLVCGLTVAISVAGDLFESWFKRRRGVKDSGTLLPGHGGMLDRIDSLTAAAPWFWLGFILLQAVHR